MKPMLLTIGLMAVLFVSGCATGDMISLQNAREAEDTAKKYLDPALPESARKTEQLRARKAVEYEESKFGK